MKERNWNKLYKTYEKRYAKQEKVSNRLGVPIDRKYNKAEFKTTYIAMEADFEASGKKVPNITQNLTRNQMLYKYTPQQARFVRQAIQDLNLNGTLPKFGELRKSGSEAVPRILWDKIKNRYQELKNRNLGSVQAKHIIGFEFFGSQ